MKSASRDVKYISSRAIKRIVTDTANLSISAEAVQAMNALVDELLFQFVHSSIMLSGVSSQEISISSLINGIQKILPVDMSEPAISQGSLLMREEKTRSKTISFDAMIFNDMKENTITSPDSVREFLIPYYRIYGKLNFHADCVLRSAANSGSGNLSQQPSQLRVEIDDVDLGAFRAGSLFDALSTIFMTGVLENLVSHYFHNIMQHTISNKKQTIKMEEVLNALMSDPVFRERFQQTEVKSKLERKVTRKGRRSTASQEPPEWVAQRRVSNNYEPPAEETTKVATLESVRSQKELAVDDVVQKSSNKSDPVKAVPNVVIQDVSQKSEESPVVIEMVITNPVVVEQKKDNVETIERNEQAVHPALPSFAVVNTLEQAQLAHNEEAQPENSSKKIDITETPAIKPTVEPLTIVERLEEKIVEAGVEAPKPSVEEKKPEPERQAPVVQANITEPHTEKGTNASKLDTLLKDLKLETSDDFQNSNAPAVAKTEVLQQAMPQEGIIGRDFLRNGRLNIKSMVQSLDSLETEAEEKRLLTLVEFLQSSPDMLSRAKSASEITDLEAEGGHEILTMIEFLRGTPAKSKTRTSFNAPRSSISNNLQKKEPGNVRETEDELDRKFRKALIEFLKSGPAEIDKKKKKPVPRPMSVHSRRSSITNQFHMSFPNSEFIAKLQGSLRKESKSPKPDISPPKDEVLETVAKTMAQANPEETMEEFLRKTQVVAERVENEVRKSKENLSEAKAMDTAVQARQKSKPEENVREVLRHSQIVLESVEEADGPILSAETLMTAPQPVKQLEAKEAGFASIQKLKEKQEKEKAEDEEDEELGIKKKKHQESIQDFLKNSTPTLVSPKSPPVSRVTFGVVPKVVPKSEIKPIEKPRPDSPEKKPERRPESAENKMELTEVKVETNVTLPPEAIIPKGTVAERKLMFQETEKLQARSSSHDKLDVDKKDTKSSGAKVFRSKSVFTSSKKKKEKEKEEEPSGELEKKEKKGFFSNMLKKSQDIKPREEEKPVAPAIPEKPKKPAFIKLPFSRKKQEEAPQMPLIQESESDIAAARTKNLSADSNATISNKTEAASRSQLSQNISNDSQATLAHRKDETSIPEMPRDAEKQIANHTDKQNESLPSQIVRQRTPSLPGPPALPPPLKKEEVAGSKTTAETKEPIAPVERQRNPSLPPPLLKKEVTESNEKPVDSTPESTIIEKKRTPSLPGPPSLPPPNKKDDVVPTENKSTEKRSSVNVPSETTKEPQANKPSDHGPPSLPPPNKKDDVAPTANKSTEKRSSVDVPSETTKEPQASKPSDYDKKATTLDVIDKPRPRPQSASASTEQGQTTTDNDLLQQNIILKEKLARMQESNTNLLAQLKQSQLSQMGSTQLGSTQLNSSSNVLSLQSQNAVLKHQLTGAQTSLAESKNLISSLQSQLKQIQLQADKYKLEIDDIKIKHQDELSQLKGERDVALFELEVVKKQLEAILSGNAVVE